MWNSVWLRLSLFLLWPGVTLADLGEEEPLAKRKLGKLTAIAQAAFNHDGSRVIVRLRSGETGIFDRSNGSIMGGELPSNTLSGGFVMSGDGRLLLAQFENGARIFDATLATAVSPVLDVPGDDEWPPQAVFSPDNTTVCVLRKKECGVFKIRTGERIVSIPLKSGPNEDAVGSVFFTDKGDFCFVMDGAGAVTRYETKTWKVSGAEMKHPPADSAYNFGFSVSRDGKWMATFDDPGENGPHGNLQLWDAETGKRLGKTLSAVNGYTARFIPGVNRVLALPGRGEAGVRDLPSMKSRYAIRQHDDVEGPEVEISPNGQLLISWGADRTIHVHSADDAKIAGTHSGGATIASLSISPDSKTCFVHFENTAFLSEHHHDHYIVKFSLPALEIVASARITDYVHRMTLSPDGSQLLLLQGEGEHDRVVLLSATTLR